MSSLGRLVVTLAANTAEFASDLGKAAHEAAQRMEGMQRMATKVGVAIGAMFAAGVGTAAVLVKQAADSADMLFKLSQSTGIAIGKLSEYNYVAQLSGVDTAALATSIARLNRNMVDAVSGSGEGIRGFDALGVSVKNADGSMKSADKVIEEVADKFAGMEDGAGKTSIAMLLFGKAGAQMIPMLNMGSEGIRQMREEANALGATLTDEMGRAAELANDNISRLGQVSKGMANQIMVAVLPAFNAFTDELVETAKNGDLMRTTAEAAAAGMKGLLTAIVAITAAFRIGGDSLGKFAAAIGAVLRGEWSSAVEIMKTDSGDMASVIEAAMRQIQGVWTATADTAVKSADQVAKAAAPVVKSTEEITAARKAAEKEAQANAKLTENLLKADAAAWVKHAEEVFATEEKRLQDLAALRETAGTGLASIVDELSTGETLAQEAHERKLEQLRLALTTEHITQEEFDNLAEQLELKHQQNLATIYTKGLNERQKFLAMGMKDQAKTIFGELANITAGVSQHNRTLFELNKVAGIAMAIVNAYEGISLTMAKYPYPLNIAMAAAHGIAAFAQVQAIRGTSFSGGGGAAPSIAGSTAAPAVTPVSGGAPGQLGQSQDQQQGQTTVVVQFNGTTDEQKLLRRFVDLLNENSRDGGRILVSPT